MNDNKKKINKQPQHKNFKLAEMNPCVAGIDIGTRSVFVCIGFSDGHQEIREYLTFTKDLKDMLKWLKTNGIQSVAMESTGVFWIPVYDILAQAGLDVQLVNAYSLKSVPGRKTDVKDCQWIQQLHAYGLLRGSFRPDDEGVTLRGYVRQRSRLYELAAQQVQLMQKAMVQMNLRLNHVVSDITGSTGMKIIRAIVSGEKNPVVLANFRNKNCKKNEHEIAKALEGNYREDQLLALKHALLTYDMFHKQVVECEEEIKNLLKNWKEEVVQERPPSNENNSGSGSSDSNTKKIPTDSKKKMQMKTDYNRSPYHFNIASELRRILGVDLTSIPGIDVNGIMKILAEIGRDMSKWKTVKHFVSWLGLCPGNKISGGKILSSKTKPSANKAAQALRMAANSLYRSKTALGAYFRRKRAQLGAPKAITAVAHKLARILYSMLKEKKEFIEIGQEKYEEAYRQRCLFILEKQAKKFGLELVERS